VCDPPARPGRERPSPWRGAERGATATTWRAPPPR
jgi:hypothetical protein